MVYRIIDISVFKSNFPWKTLGQHRHPIIDRYCESRMVSLDFDFHKAMVFPQGHQWASIWPAHLSWKPKCVYEWRTVNQRESSAVSLPTSTGSQFSSLVKSLQKTLRSNRANRSNGDPVWVRLADSVSVWLVSPDRGFHRDLVFPKDTETPRHRTQDTSLVSYLQSYILNKIPTPRYVQLPMSKYKIHSQGSPAQGVL